MNITSSNFFMTNKINNNFKKNKDTNVVPPNNTNTIQTPETVDSVNFDITNEDLKSLFDGIFNMISTNKANKTEDAQPTEETKEATSAEKAQFEKDCNDLIAKLDEDIKICKQKMKEIENFANKEMLLILSDYEKENEKILQEFNKLEERFEELEEKSKTGELTPSEENEKLKLAAMGFKLRERVLDLSFAVGKNLADNYYNANLCADNYLNFDWSSDLNKTMEDLQNRKSELNLSDNSIIDKVSQKISLRDTIYEAYGKASSNSFNTESSKTDAIYDKSKSKIENSKLIQYGTENWEKLDYKAPFRDGRTTEMTNEKIKAFQLTLSK